MSLVTTHFSFHDFFYCLKYSLVFCYVPISVKYLLVLQSCGASEAVKPTPKSINNNKKPTPKWVQAACGSLLTHCLTQSDKGVLNVIQGILDLGMYIFYSRVQCLHQF